MGWRSSRCGRRRTRSSLNSGWEWRVSKASFPRVSNRCLSQAGAAVRAKKRSARPALRRVSRRLRFLMRDLSQVEMQRDTKPAIAVGLSGIWKGQSFPSRQPLPTRLKPKAATHQHDALHRVRSHGEVESREPARQQAATLATSAPSLHRLRPQAHRVVRGVTLASCPRRARHEEH